MTESWVVTPRTLLGIIIFVMIMSGIFIIILLSILYSSEHHFNCDNGGEKKVGWKDDNVERKVGLKENKVERKVGLKENKVERKVSLKENKVGLKENKVERKVGLKENKVERKVSLKENKVGLKENKVERKVGLKENKVDEKVERKVSFKEEKKDEKEDSFKEVGVKEELNNYTDYTDYYESTYNESEDNEFKMLDNINLNMLNVVDNQSPVIKKSHLMIRNRSILPSSLTINIVDYTSFSKGVLFVVADGDDGHFPFLYDVKTRSVFPVKPSISLDQVDRIGKRIFAVSSGALYMYDIPTLEKGVYVNHIEWQHVDVPVNQVTRISPGKDRLWLQSRCQGCYLNSDLEIGEIEDIVEGSLRFCGLNDDLTLIKGIANVKGQLISNVYMAIADGDDWTFIKNNDYTLSGIMNAKLIDSELVLHSYI